MSVIRPRQLVPDDEPTSERSYGIIPIRRTPPHSNGSPPQLSTSNTQVLLISQKPLLNAHPPFWSFPKGHPEPHDTSPIDTAIRELREETGLHVSETSILFPGAEGLKERYRNVLKGWVKEVRYWVALVEQPDHGEEGELAIKVQEKELLEAKWFSWEEAGRVLTFEKGKELLAVARGLLDNHGKARVGEEGKL